METTVFGTSSPEETERFGAALASVLSNGDVVLLTGDLGAGKTCLTRGLGSGLGVSEQITSPTFTLANRFEADGLLLHHLDVYRLESLGETFDLDLPDLIDSGVTVIEWGEQIRQVLDTDYLVVALRYPPVPPDVGLEADDVADVFIEERQRLITLEAVGRSWQDRMVLLTERLAEWNRSGNQ